LSGAGGAVALANSKIFPLPDRAPVASPAPARIRLRPYLLFAYLVTISVLLAAADLITLALDETVGSVQLRETFNVDEEQSIPTWFSSIQLFAAHLLLVLIAWLESHRSSRHATYWWSLAIILLVLSADEVVGFHENGSLVLKNMGVGGDWVVLGALVAAAVGVAFIPFLLSLPRLVAAFFVTAGVLLLAGALGVELWDLSILDDEKTFLTGLVPATEEFLERLGISVFILGLLVYMREHLGLRGLALT
jgi:hypothetical protein